jgi:SAM-dependent methyltransferase
MFIARDWYLRLIDGEFRYVRCESCGTIRQDPMVDARTLSRAYTTYHEQMPEAEGLLQRGIERIAQREANFLAGDADTSLPVVDIGCGAGLFLRRLGRAGWVGERRGVEPEGEVAATASARLGITVEKGLAEDLSLEAGGVGTAVMRHVIEHLLDPADVLDRLHRAIAPGGTLYLGTPDARALSAKVFGQYWHGYDPPRHVHVFTASSMRTLVRAHGFEPVRERWFWQPEMWTGSLRHRLTDGHDRPLRRAFAHDRNPLLVAPASVAAGVEVAMRRSTMYSITARRVD